MHPYMKECYEIIYFNKIDNENYIIYNIRGRRKEKIFDSQNFQKINGNVSVDNFFLSGHENNKIK
jgi:hypothetical protein